MPAPTPYPNNSPSKEFIRNKWIEYTKAILARKEGKELEIIAMPALEMQDIHLLVDEGILEWEETETEASTEELNDKVYRITKGRVVCFEKSHDVEMKLVKKLVNSKVYTEIASYLQVNYHKILLGKQPIFPIDVINLDFDGNLSKNKIGIQQLIKLIFEFQEKHGSDFCLFLTFPNTEGEDEPAFKQALTEVLSQNLTDEHTHNFRDGFASQYTSIEAMGYEKFLIVSIAKIIIKQSSGSFKILKNEFFTYTGGTGMRMLSIMFDFQNIGREQAGLGQYFTEVLRSLKPINEVQVAHIETEATAPIVAPN
jgi:hypothetical protein